MKNIPHISVIQKSFNDVEDPRSSKNAQHLLIERLEKVVKMSKHTGWGYYDYISDKFSEIYLDLKIKSVY